ncbi:pan domain-containing protein [Moumouvirus maliensis]|nr:pan domain-containing protein [Moumouvirus maliensis]
MSNQNNNVGNNIFDNVRQWISKLAGSNINTTNDVLIDGRPITNNRFGNMIHNNNINKTPYYVSGTPITENSNSAILGNHDSTPYNGNFQPVRTSTLMHQTDCPGRNFWTLQVSSPNDCKNHCISRDNCKMWSFDNRNQNCFLKNDIMPCNSDSDYTSGRIGINTRNVNNPTPTPYNPTPTPYSPTPQNFNPSPQIYPSPLPVQNNYYDTR